MRRLVGASFCGALGLLACGGEQPASGRAGPGPAADDAGTTTAAGEAGEEDFLVQAHAEALGELAVKVEDYVAKVQPVESAAALGTELRVPYVPGPDEASLQKQLEAMVREAKEIRRGSLSVTDGRRFAAFHLLHERDEWRGKRAGPYVSDALWYLAGVESWIRELRFRLLINSECEDCLESIKALEGALMRAASLLTTASPENLAAAKPRAARLADELADLRGLVPGHTHADLDAAVVALRRHGETVAALPLANAPGEDGPRPWTIPPTHARGEALVARPGAWGPERLRDILSREEDYQHEAGSFRDEAQPKLERFRKMRADLERRSASKPAGAVAPVDLARCEAAWKPMEEFAKSKAGFTPKLSCERVVAWLEGRELDDRELAAGLLREGLVAATLHESASSRGGLLAALGGRWGRELGWDYRAVMFAFPLLEAAPGVEALRRLEHWACLSTVALEVHSGVTDDQLDPWLETWCPEQSPKAWRTEAMADPRRAFTGVPVLLMGDTPAEMVPVVEYGWAMYGMAKELARPEDAPPEPKDPSEMDAKIRIQEIDPEKL